MHLSPSLAHFQAFAATDIFRCILKAINYWKLEVTDYWKLEATNYWGSEGLVVRLFFLTSTSSGGQDVDCFLELVEDILHGELVAVEPLTKLQQILHLLPTM